MSKSYETIGKFPIYFDQTYFLCYAGGSRGLTNKQQKEWDKTLQLPGELQLIERKKLGPENNPNIIPLKGRDLLIFIKELKFVPFFDLSFPTTHMVKLTDIVIYESIKAKSYEMAMRDIHV